MSKKWFKILFLGLYSAGKSSFLGTLGNLSSSSTIKGKIKGANKLQVEFLGFAIDLFDFGGIKAHIDEFIEKHANYCDADLI